MFAKIFSILSILSISSMLLLADEGKSIVPKAGETFVVVKAVETGRDFGHRTAGGGEEWYRSWTELSIGYDLELSDGAIINITITWSDSLVFGSWVQTPPTEFLISIYNTFNIEPGDELVLSSYGGTRIKDGWTGWKEFRTTLIRDGNTFYSENGWVKGIKPEINWWGW